jgi:hypothetical protein
MLNDLLVCAGLAAIGVGLWIAWPPLSLCVVGALLIAGGTIRAKPAKPETES